MKELRLKNALISVYNKEGMVELARELDNAGVNIISTSGTHAKLAEEGIKATKVEDIASSPELLDGRVKTLQPEIFASILVNRDKKEHLAQLKSLKLEPIDIVVVNLYPFKSGLDKNLSDDEMIELIDIGGASLIRAGAKNYKSCLVLSDPSDYKIFIQKIKEGKGVISLDYRKKQAEKAFRQLSFYNKMIADYYLKSLGEKKEEFTDFLSLDCKKIMDLRYGENPHQKSSVYRFTDSKISLLDAEQLWGKPMSYNNWMDTDGAVGAVSEFDKTCVAIIKHAAPCGIGVADSVLDAFKKAQSCDPLSAFGGIISSNREIDLDTAEAIAESFFEVVLAPAYTEDALTKLKEKKNLRILEAKAELFSPLDYMKCYPIIGGILMQQSDSSSEDPNGWDVVSKKEPTQEEVEDLDFAWRVVKWVKSNAIVLAKDLKTIGIGTGQPSRVDSVEISILKAKKYGHEIAGAVLASDAFFPFRDSIDKAKEAGVTAIVEPGGSVRDKEVIDAANEHNIALLFTGKRHFRH
ncbi:bifunctional phosphoribosylaminoimidazolecarboxamide formyltransferase/IMP cyclohydrolase [candidate division WOR-3 bacterium]|nr:bifunctional phosphoribosylaminoimidazolecarboxamide formyltransferase/IMP cyclohydrolase [candidate division WOR-3 bacterium]